ncbi:MAG: glycoside hydrolase family 3 C-terminal domain-containing protein [Spirochaetota bacterium]
MDVREIVRGLSLTEKASLCSGKDTWRLKPIDRVDLPSIRVADGPHGLRKQARTAQVDNLGDSIPSTCFPPAATTACSWSPALLEEIGRALGRECIDEDVAVLLGPGANIKRSPLGGRNFEYFSEDPYLAGRLAAGFIRGVQGEGVGTSLKHFVANNQERHRMVVDTIVDERTLREIYLAAFEYPVRSARPWTVMCSYNRVNGTYLSDHRELIGTVLRNEWGYDGVVVTDWGALNDRIAAIEAGVDLEMPGGTSVTASLIVRAVRQGRLSETLLDRTAERIVRLIATATRQQRTRVGHDPARHHELARRAAEESAVLMKNEGGALPLERTGSIAVIGTFAVRMRFQGSGSSKVAPTRVEQPLAAISELVGDGASIAYCAGYSIDDDAVDDRLIREATGAARDADRAVLFLGLPSIYESETFDRTHMRLPRNQLALVDALLDAGVEPIVVLQNGSPVELPFLDRVPAVLETYLPGQAGGGATARLLFGDADPGGKLAETFPRLLEDNPSHPWFPGRPRQVQYREGIWVGYRYYATAGVPVALPFGHGLSYTTFDYGDLAVATARTDATDDAGTVDPSALTEDSGITVSCTITNTGGRPGWETVQLYVSDVASTVHRPELELKGFVKVRLEPGEQSRVQIDVGTRAFAVWDTGTQSWMIEAGEFRLHVGSSSTDLRLATSLSMRGTGRPSAPPEEVRWYHRPFEGTARIDDHAFAAVLGGPVPPEEPAGPFHRNSTLQEIGLTPIGRIVQRRVYREILNTIAADSEQEREKLARHLASELPLRSLTQQGSRSLSPRAVDALIELLNGRPVRALTGLLGRRR